jgi:hypothetical protein
VSDFSDKCLIFLGQKDNGQQVTGGDKLKSCQFEDFKRLLAARAERKAQADGFLVRLCMGFTCAEQEKKGRQQSEQKRKSP